MAGLFEQVGAAFGRRLNGRLNSIFGISALDRLTAPIRYLIAGSPDRRIAGSPDRRIAGSPDRRIAGSPDRRIAGSPDRRIAGSPDRRIAQLAFRGRLMRAPAWLRCLPPDTPPEPSPPAGLWRGFCALLLALTLTLGLAAGAQAQTLSISAPADADEGDSGTRDLTFTVTLSEALSRSVLYQICLTGTATPDFTGQSVFPTGTDYQPIFDSSPSLTVSCTRAAFLSIQLGTTSSTTFGIRVQGDSVLEADETVIATLSITDDRDQSVTLGTSVATHTIRNDDQNNAPTVATDLPDHAVTAAVAFSHQFPANTFRDADTHSLSYRAAQSDGSDLPSWLTFTPGTRTFSGTPAADDAGTVTVRVTADDGNGGTVTDDFNIVVSATPPTVTITGDRDEVSEGRPAPFTLTRTGPTTSALTVQVSVTDGNNCATLLATGQSHKSFICDGGDAGNQEVTIPAGAASVSYGVTTVEDSRDEDNGEVTVTLLSNAAYTLGSPSSATVEVWDNDEPPNSAPTVATAIPDQAAIAGTAFSYVVPQATFSDTDTDALSYTATLADDDGSDLPAWLTFTPGTRTFSGRPVADDAGTLTVRVTADDGNGGTVSDEFDIVVSAPEVTVTGGPPVTEGAEAVFTVRRTGPTTSALTVGLNVTEITSDGQEFVAPEDEGSKEVTIQAGDATATYRVPTVQDTTDEPNGAVRVVPQFGETYRIAVNADPVVTVNDNVVPTVATAIPDQTGAAAAARVGEAFTYLVPEATFSDTDNDALTYTATLADDDGSDLPAWLGFDADLLTFSGTPGADDVGTVSVRVTADDDNGGTVADEFDIEVRIVPVVTVTGGAAVTEGAEAVFTVRRTGPTTSALTVGLNVTEITSDGQDFVAPEDEGSKEVTIQAGDAAATYRVPTVNDAVEEPDGEVALEVLSDSDAYTIVLGTDPVVTVTDNDGDPANAVPTVSLSVSKSGAVTEGDDPLTITATRSEVHRSDATAALQIPIRVKVADTTAQAGDYTLAAASISIAQGESSGTVTFTVVNDDADEDAETVVVELGPLPEGTEAGTPGEITITITDDDGPPTQDVSAAVQAGLTRFGRTVGEQSVATVRDRLTASRRTGFRGTLAGQALPEVDDTLAQGGESGSQTRSQTGRALVSEDMRRLRDWLAGPDAGTEAGTEVSAGAVSRSDALDATDIVAGTSFALTRETNAGGALALWGRGAVSGFSGRQDGVDIDGDVKSFQLGSDWSRGDLTYGLMLSRSRGDLDYRGGDAPGDAFGGTIETTLSALVPYMGWDVNDRISAWGTLGIGRGRMTLRPDGGAALNTDIDWQMAAAGLDGTLAGTLGGADLGWSADALWTRTRSDAVPGGLVALSGRAHGCASGLRPPGSGCLPAAGCCARTLRWACAMTAATRRRASGLRSAAAWTGAILRAGCRWGCRGGRWRCTRTGRSRTGGFPWCWNTIRRRTRSGALPPGCRMIWAGPPRAGGRRCWVRTASPD